MPNITGASTRPRGMLVCKACQTQIALRKSVLSWSFRGYSGKAALFTKVSNVILNKPTVLLMDSGAHTVQEFSCEKCSTLLGWQIIRAHEWPEKWKEGYSVLELALLEERIPDSSSYTIVKPSMLRTSSSSPLGMGRDGSGSGSGSENSDVDMNEEHEEPKVVAFNAYLQVASALSKGHRRASSDADATRLRPAGPRALTPTPGPGTPPRRSVDVQS